MRRTRVRASTAAMLARGLTAVRLGQWLAKPLWLAIVAGCISEASAPLSTATVPSCCNNFPPPFTRFIMLCPSQYTHSDSWGHVRHLLRLFQRCSNRHQGDTDLTRFRPEQQLNGKNFGRATRNADPMAPSVDSALSTRAGRAAGCADRKRRLSPGLRLQCFLWAVCC